jgi:hypothetical protein
MKILEKSEWISNVILGSWRRVHGFTAWISNTISRVKFHGNSQVNS